MNDQELLRYSRHILLDEIDIGGQQRLLNSAALVVGCGGLGAAALPYLAAAGVGRLLIADDDTVEWSNLQRQVSYSESDVGSLKTAAMAARLHAINSGCRIETFGRLDEAALRELLPQCGVLLDCCDNFATRRAVNAAAHAASTPLVSGAAVRFSGQLAVFRHDLPEQPCYACLFGEPEGGDGSCALTGVFSPLVGVIGAIQAVEALKILLGLPAQPAGLHCYDALAGSWQHFAATKNPACPVCSPNKGKAA